MKTRTENVKLNLIYGYVAQIGLLLLSFIGRKIFLRYLSVEYLGINGLFSNILTVLSIAELGLDSAIVYSLYRPVADENYPLIGSLLAYFRKLYWGVACCIFLVGVALVPFLGDIVNSDMSSDVLVICYLLYLINSTISYFGAHNIALLLAYQEQRFQKITTLFVGIGMQMLHILVLCLFKNYYVYVACNIVGTLSTCIIVSLIAHRRHSQIYRSKIQVNFDRKPIFERIKATLLYKLGAVAVNNTTNILISMIIGVSAVGLYSNYIVVVNAVQALIATISVPLMNSLGNMCITASSQKIRSVFYMLVWFFNIVSFTCFAGFLLLFNELIVIWIGPAYVLDTWSVFAIAFSFLLNNLTTPVWVYREVNGLFSEVRYLLLIMAGLNVAISIVLGKVFGLFGVLMGNPISRILTLIWCEPKIVCKKVLKTSQHKYWRLSVKGTGIGVLCIVILYWLLSFLPVSIGLLPAKALIVCVVVVAGYVLIGKGTSENKELMQYVLSVVRKRRIKY